MKLLLKLLLSIVLLFLALVSLGYAILRSHWGIAAACRWISDTTPYHLSIERLTHDWSHPLTFQIDKVTFGEDGQPALLIAGKLSLSLTARQLMSPGHFSQITVEQGTLVLSNLTPEATLPISADRLELQAVKLLNPYPTDSLSAKQINGVLSPWQPSQQAVLGKTFTFNFSAEEVHVAHRQFDKLVAQGNKDHQRLNIAYLSGAVERGTFTGKLSRSSEGQWQIPSLQLDNIRFQTDKRLTEIFGVNSLPEVTVQDLTINHLSIVGPDWVVNDLSANGQDLTNTAAFAGRLALNAESVIVGTDQWSQPHLRLTAGDGNISLDQFNSGWAKGTVSAQGLWQGKTGDITLDKLSFSDIRYTLPSDWRQFLQAQLPAFIRSITLNNLSVENGLLIDINPDYPFQMTATHITGNQLQIAQQRQWGLWGGNAEYYAAAATFNRQDIGALWFKLNANNERLALQDIKGLVEGGPVIGDLAITQSSTRPFSLSLRGEKVPYTAFSRWFWPHPLSGKGNFSLILNGNLPSITASPSSLKGVFNTPTFTQQVAPE
ncbi:hypothetical protein HH682_08995 [Rosenbergiella sp. S61]|uniref:AsmA family protein n=1 Tax=Rosenbergiella gaditana TaxID=2726987 RepID=A0ABS5SX29_9GAMM|nr:AsmA family protein [Rosenbergiella gaditana]MBT0724566.1 hypothetical protein [Rosenbergiella gaditana]